MKVKVCGMCDPHNIPEVAALHPDYMGFIFYKKSPRHAGNLVPEVVHALPRNIHRIGVFVDASADEVLATMNKYRLDMVQLHGDKTPEFCSRLTGKYPVVKALAVHSADDIRSACEKYNRVTDYLLFDTKTPLYGGSGQQFDWSVLDAYTGEVPFFLSGGIGPGDASRLRTLKHPRLHAIDINSRFETEPGLKDAALLESFLLNFNQECLHAHTSTMT